MSLACRSILHLGAWLAVAMTIAAGSADATITYDPRQTACVSPRVATPGQVAQDGTACGTSVAGFGTTRQAQVPGLTARAALTTTGSLLPDSLTLDATAKAQMTVSAPAEGAGGYAISQIALLFTMTEGRSFKLDASLAGTVGGGTYIFIRSNSTGSTVVQCKSAGPCKRSGVLPAGDYVFFANAEQRFNSGGTAVGIETTLTIKLEIGAGGLPTPTPTSTPPVIRWNNPAGGDFNDSGNWDPQQVPTVDQNHEDNAAFELVEQYGVNVAGAKANRMIIRESSIDLVGGTATVSSPSLAEPSLVVGQNGKLHLVSGTFSSVHSVLGDVSGPLAEVDLISGAPTWTNSGRLTIGDAGPGRLTVVSGEVTSAEARIGGGLLGTGEAIVGAPGRWTTGDLGLGLGGGPGTLEIRDGGVVVSDGARIGVAFGSGNAVTVRGADPNDTDEPSSWDLAGELMVAADGAGTLSVEESAVVGCASLVVGGGIQGVGTATVTGAANGFASTLKVDNAIGVGIEGVGALAVADGASAQAADAVIGSKASGTLTVADAGSRVTVTNAIVVGGDSGFDARPNADGTLRIEDGGTVTADRLALGVNPQSKGHVVVSGEAAGGSTPSQLTLTTLLRVGGDGAADVVVEDGARLDLADGADVEVSTPIIGTPVLASGSITVRGVGTLGTQSVFRTLGDVQVGGGGSMLVTDGALARAGTLGVGRGGDGDWRVGGGPHTSDSVVEGLFALGILDGTGRLTVTKGGRVFATSGLTVGLGSPGHVLLDARSAGQTGLTVPLLSVTGALEIGFGAPGAVVLDGGKLTASGTTTIHVVGVLTGNGQLTGAIVNDGGCFIVSPQPTASAGCALPAALTRAVSVRRSPAATARASRGKRATLDPTIVVDGTYQSQPGSVVRIELDGSGSGLQVIGDATFAGTLQIVFRDGFVPRAGESIPLFDVLGATGGAFTDTVVSGLPPGWDGEISETAAGLALTVFGDYLCYQTGPAKGTKFPKGLAGTLGTSGGAIDFGIKKPVLLCNPSGPSTGSQQAVTTQLRGYLVTDPSGDPLGIATRALRVTNGLHPNGELVVDTKATTLAVAAAAKCIDVPPGTCPTDLPAPSNLDAFVCAPAKASKAGAAFPKNLVASAVDTFGEARTYKLGKPTRVCAPTTGALDHALACYAAKALGKVCALDAPSNATAACKSELDCGGVKKVTTFCAKQGKHVKVTDLVLATSLASDRATTQKPIELCVPTALTAP